MKKLFNLIIVIAIVCGQCLTANAQVPAPDFVILPYSGVARDGSGNILANQNIALRFSIHDAVSNGAVVYSETQSATTNILGLFNLNIGAGTPVTGTMAGVNWAAYNKFLQVEMDATGGTNYINMGTTQLLPVPYAMYAQNAGKAHGSVNFVGTWNASANTPDLSSAIPEQGDYYVVNVAGATSLDGITDWQPGDWAIYDGTLWGKVDNTESAVVADNVAFTPTTEITSTNVQGALEELQSDFANTIDSYIHLYDDNVSIYLPPGGLYKRFGIGETAPDCPLGIKAEGVNESLISFHDASSASKWHINRNPDASSNTGFNIDQVTSTGNASRFFIKETNGYVGIGSTTPDQKLHVQGANDGANVSMLIENTEAGINTGWLMSAIDDNAITPRQNTFAIQEKNGSSLLERITVLPTSSAGIKNVGINEVMPYATLHVTRPASDPLEPVTLAENTGILCLGQIDDDNLAMDSRQIQARHGEYIGGGSTLSFTNSPLSLQPLGGGIKINGSMAPPQQAIITNDGMLGLGTTTPLEKVHIDGAIMIGTTFATNDGTIRYTGNDFEGRKGGAWISLTADNGPWTTLNNTIYYNAGTAPRAAIGSTLTDATLHVEDNETVTTGSIGLLAKNKSTNTGAGGQDDNRIGLQIECSNAWGGNPLAKNIGLYVKEVTGQNNHHANIAAVLNGSVVVGDITTSSMVGSNGSRVLAIQNGTAPTTISGSGLAADGGIQLYSQSDAMGVSTFHLMNGDGTIMKLFRAAALTPADNSTISTTIYGTTEADVINNLRQRINDLEAKLQAFGLLN